MTDQDHHGLPDAGRPDPSTLTLIAIEQAAAHHEQLVDAQLQGLVARLEGFVHTANQRMDSMDRATEIRAENLVRLPSEVQQAADRLQELTDVKFADVRCRLVTLNDQRLRDNETAAAAVKTALDAQRDATAALDKSNAMAIRKAELSTAETIVKLEQLVATQVNNLSNKLEDSKNTAADARNELSAALAAVRQELSTSLSTVRSEIVSITARTSGVHEQVRESRDSATESRAALAESRARLTAAIAISAVVVSVISIIVAIVIAAGK